MTRLSIRNLGGVATGRIAEPVLHVDAISCLDGRIEAFESSSPADRIVDAGGAWLLPGLWDGDYGLYFGDHEPRYSARGTIAASVGFGVTTIVAGRLPEVHGWSAEPRADRELAVLASRSWRHDRPRGIKVITAAVRANLAWGDADLDALRETGATILTSSAIAERGALRDLRVLADGYGFRLGLLLDDALVDPDRLIDDVDPTFVVVRSGAAGALESAERLLSAGVRALGAPLTAGPRALLRLVSVAAQRGLLDRMFLGSGLPDEPGVLAAALPLAVELLSAAGVVSGPQAIALASGNVARALGAIGGTIEAGQPADLSLAAATNDAVPTWSDRRVLTLIDGIVAWEAPGRPRATPTADR